MKITFQGVTVEGDYPDVSRKTAIETRIRQLFYRVSMDPPSLDLVASLDEIKVWATEAIRQEAEAQRGQHITTRPGKILEYVEKRGEYDRWEAEDKPTPDAGAFPIATKEAVEWGYSTAEMLEVWKEAGDKTRLGLADIAAIERKTLLGIEAAKDEAGLVEVLAGVEWA